MRARYNPSEFEDEIYDIWCRSGIFEANVDSSKQPFTIMMPPPNITGQLHMGHALNNTLQDVIIRYKRMQGYNALWVAGTDHASIATELKIVESLKAEGKQKTDLSRDEFLDRAYAWKDTYGGKIVAQLKKLGVSCDWRREAFTMDKGCSDAVQSVFVSMYNEGIIYRGDRIINWCTDCKTAISDAEVEYEARESKLWHIRYMCEDGKNSVVVATTRPETMLGDTAVAVNPNDARYKELVGKMFVLPIIGRKIPIIADSYVDAKFGSGAVKITPAHDPNDFAVGERHGLDIIKVMDDDGTINCAPCKGMDRYTAREYIVDMLDKSGALVKVEKHDNNVGHCYRCHNVIEPLVSKQWFVKMDTLSVPAVSAVKNGEVAFLPSKYSKIYLHWMNNIKDWCISRQLWWGHRIPAYYCNDCGEMTVSIDTVHTCPKCGGATSRDEAVLDTWFSSALWPFSTLGYPNKTDDLAYFYPTNVIVTAYDIIFFWIARMIFSGIHHMGEVPFAKVMIHGIVRDEQGRKMSKSLGNGIDPLEIIGEYGADALRYSLLTGIAAGSDIRYSKSKLEGSQNFLNKIFNASKFVLMNIDGVDILDISRCKLSIADKWILSKLSATISRVVLALDKYDIGSATGYIYAFVWYDFCDWYIEVAKTELYSTNDIRRQNTASVLVYVLDNILRLLHPFVPFVTEEIYKDMPSSRGLIAIAQYPTKLKTYSKESKEFEFVIELVAKLRSVRKEINIPQSKKMVLYASDVAMQRILQSNMQIVQRLGGIADIIFEECANNAISVLTSKGVAKIPYDGLINVQDEIDRLAKELVTATAERDRASAKISNQGFVAKAPKELINNEKQKIIEYTDRIQKLQQEIKQLNDIAD